MKYIIKNKHLNTYLFDFLFQSLGLNVPVFGTKKEAIIFNSRKEAEQVAQNINNVEIVEI